MMTRILIILLMMTNTYAGEVLSFAQAIEIARRNNPDLQAVIDKAAATKGFFTQSKQFPNPALALTAENIGGSGRYSGFESAETTLSYSQPIPLGRRLHYLQNATEADYKTAEMSIQIREAALESAVGLAYVDALYAEQWVEVAQKLSSLNKEITDSIKRRMEAGAGAELDFRLSEIKQGEATIQAVRAQRNARIAWAQLERVMSIDFLTHKKLTDKNISHHLPSWETTLKRLPKSPQLQAKQLQLTAKRATIMAVKKDVWPNLNVQIGARHFSDDGSNAAIISTSAPIPLFDRNQGKVATEEAQFRQIEHELLSTRLELKQNLFGFYLQAEQFRYEGDQVHEKLLPLARKAVHLATEGYRQGRYTYLELSNAINALYDEEKHYQQVHADYHKALIQMAGLLGPQAVKENTHDEK